MDPALDLGKDQTEERWGISLRENSSKDNASSSTTERDSTLYPTGQQASAPSFLTSEKDLGEWTSDTTQEHLDLTKLNRPVANKVVARLLAWMGEAQYKPTADEFRPMRKQFLMSLSGLILGTWAGRFGLVRAMPTTRTLPAPLQWGVGFTLLGYPASLLAITCTATSTTREVLQQKGILGAQAREAYRAVLAEKDDPTTRGFFSFPKQQKPSEYRGSLPPPPPPP